MVKKLFVFVIIFVAQDRVTHLVWEKLWCCADGDRHLLCFSCVLRKPLECVFTEKPTEILLVKTVNQEIQREW